MKVLFLRGKGYRQKLIGVFRGFVAYFCYKKLHIINLMAFFAAKRSKAIGEIPSELSQWIGNHSVRQRGKSYDFIYAKKFAQEQILSRCFDLLGHQVKYKGRKILWNIDPISKYRWERIYFERLKPVFNITDNTDGKLPYELSRFQHLPSFANSYQGTGDRSFIKEAMWQIGDWINENPCPYGINWTCAMEVAIRACNWMWVWWAFKDEPEWTEGFDRKFLKSMWQHGWYIEHNLEDKGGIRTNHYLSDVVGLLFIGNMFPNFKDAERWKAFGAKELVRCMDEMVYEDGVSFENSTAYHRLVLELFTYSALLCKKNDIDIPPAFWTRLEKMFEFILYTMRPDGKMPMIGDNDDGRFFILSGYYDWDRWDFSYLLYIGAVIFNRADFKAAAEKTPEDIYWLFSEQEIERYEQL